MEEPEEKSFVKIDIDLTDFRYHPEWLFDVLPPWMIAELVQQLVTGQSPWN